MVHKKYTYKNGKRYGPYLYETKRINGKIVTTYLGTASENKENKSKRTFNPIPILIILGLVLAVSFVFLYFPTEFTGRATLDVQANYEVGELITGNLNLNIKSGELIPENSIVIISLGEIVKEISLSELVSENLVEGNLYAEGFEISGDGKGFGLLGSKEIYPEVEFDLRVFDFEEVVEEVVEEVEESEEAQEQIVEGVEEIEEAQDEVVEVVEVVEEANEESVEEEIGGESSEETPEEEVIGGEVGEETEEVEANEEAQEEVVEANEEPEETSEEESSSAPITGEVILESEQIISGSVSYENDFVYDLLEGESAEIVEGSLGVEEAKLILETANGKAKVSTDYLEIVEGFGEGFLGEDNLVLKIDISEFGLIAEENSEMKVGLVYEENVLAEAEKDISVLEIVKAINETISNQTIANVTVNTTQYGAILGKPVKWKKKIELAEASELTIELPASAKNVSIVKIVKAEESVEILEVEEEIVEEEIEIEKVVEENDEISENETGEEQEAVEIIVEVDDEVVVSEVVEEVVEEIEGSLTGLVTIEVSDEVVAETKDNSTKEEEVILLEFNDSVEEVEIEYETLAPYAEEEELFDKKIVKIVGPEEVHYENVLAFTELNENYGITNPQQIRINWIENGTYLQPQFVGDFDENGIYDYVEWVVPHLSNQTFEIIVIIRAEHLDENRTFVSDIYEEVRNLDGNWSEEISEEHYVRVVFEKKLTSENDITIYPRIVNGTPRVEIYEIGGTDLIAEFASINSEELNKIYLTSLTGEQDTFDLKIVGGSLEFDYIVDPTAYFFEDCSDVSYWSIVPIAPLPNKWKSTAGQCVCEGCIAYSNMTSATLDLSGATSVNFTFDWDLDLSAGKHFNVSVSDDGGTTYTEVFSKIGALETTGSENITLENYISLTSSVKLKALCYATEGSRSSPADDCIWDNINLTAYDYYNPNVTINLPETLNYSTTSFNFNVSLNENASEVMFTLNGGATNYTMVADDNRNFNYTNTSVADGSYTFQVYANDTEGNQNYTESIDFTVDTTAPTISYVSPTEISGSFKNTGGVKVNVTVTDTNLKNITTTLYNSTHDSISSSTSTTSPKYNAFLTSVDGIYYFNATTYDYSGNSASISSRNVTVDTTYPTFNIVGPLNQTYTSVQSTFRPGGSDTNIDTCWYSLDDGATNTTMTCATTIDGLDSGEGSSTWTVYANDSAGNENSSSVTFFVDSLAPQVTINLPANTTYDWNNFSMNLSVNLSEAGEARFSLDGGANNISLTTINDLHFNYTNYSMADGSYTFQVYANDSLGNKNHTESVTFFVNNSRISDCSVLNETGRTYILQNNLATTGTCLTIGADNITLDGAHYNIDGDDGSSDYGLNATDVRRLTLKNLNFTDFDSGIYLEKVNDSTINDNKINSILLGHGIGVYSSNNNTIENNTILESHLSAGDGIYLTISSFNNISRNNLSNYLSNGIYLGSTSKNNTIELNVVRNTSNDGILFQSSGNNYNIIRDNNLTNTGDLEINGAYNKVLRNTIKHSKDSGIFLNAAHNSILENNTIINASKGIHIGLSENVSVRGGIINASRSYAMYFLLSGNSGNNNATIINVSVVNTSYSGYDFYDDNSITPTINDSLTLIDMSNIGNYSFRFGTNLTFKKTGLGEIKFLESIIASGTNLTNDIRISSNLAHVEIGDNPGLNKSANISLYGTPAGSISNPDMLRDVSNCSSTVCHNFTTLTAETVVFNVTGWSNYSIGDVTYPTFNITQPLNQTYTSTQTAFGPNVADDNLDICWYSLDGGVTNTTYTCLSSPIVGDSGEGSSTWTAYANDSAGNENSSSVTFFVDSLAPQVTIKSPEPNTYTTSNFVFNVTLNESGNVKFSLDGGATNYTMTPDGLFFNYSTSVSEGTHVFHAYANDTLGNQNNTENVTFIVSLPKITSSGGGGGGRGSAFSEKSPKKVKVDSKGLTINIVKGEKEERTIRVTNEGDEKINMDVDVGAIGGILKSSDKSFDLNPGESRIVKVTVSDVERGLHTGEVKFVSGDYETKVPVVVNVKSGEFLFDSAIVVDEGTRKVKQGEDVVVQIDLKQVGVEAEVDVTVTYVIKDFEGNVYLEESETFAVFDEKDFLKSIPTDDLPPGEYVVGMEVAYPGAFATASAQFEVKEKVSEFSSENLGLIVIVIALAVLILLILYFFARRKRKK